MDVILRIIIIIDPDKYNEHFLASLLNHSIDHKNLLRKRKLIKKFDLITQEIETGDSSQKKCFSTNPLK